MSEVPVDIADDVMYLSDRTCCYCQDASRRLACEIHHIDGNHENHDPDNLAVLCKEHHSQTQEKGAFARSLTPGQVRKYRDQWLASVAARRTSVSRVPELGARRPQISEGAPTELTVNAVAKTVETLRVAAYEDCRGLFLVHRCTPSDTPGQRVDITVRVYQHGDGPLNRGEILEVEYWIGRRFHLSPEVVRSPETDFEWTISAYGPVLAVARAILTSGEVINMTRYLDFDIRLPVVSDVGELGMSRPTDSEIESEERAVTVKGAAAAQDLERTMLHLVDERIDVPLRSCERQILTRILIAARASQRYNPFTGLQPGNRATDIQVGGRTEAGKQIWVMPTVWKAECGDGVIRSDGTLDSLNRLHDTLTVLMGEVYDAAHPPV